MRFSKLERTDLVINMTLAEIFLLLLFVVWYGHTAILRSDPVAQMKEKLARLERENEQLTTELKKANEDIVELRNRLDIWHQLTGFENPPSSEELTEWRKEACRSFPKCNKDNTLVIASVIHGQFSMVWLNECPNYFRWLRDSKRQLPPVETSITDINKIRSLLRDVNDYYSIMKISGAECRFDYRLTYESKEDYYDGRELFERYFYPVGLSRISITSKE